MSGTLLKMNRWRFVIIIAAVTAGAVIFVHPSCAENRSDAKQIQILKTTTDPKLKRQIAAALIEDGTPEAMTAVHENLGATYRAACGGAEPDTLMGNLTVTASISAPSRDQAAEPMRGRSIYGVNLKVHNGNSVPIAYVTQKTITDNPSVEFDYKFVVRAFNPTPFPSGREVGAGQTVEQHLRVNVSSHPTTKFRVGLGVYLTCEELVARRQLEQHLNNRLRNLRASGSTAFPVPSIERDQVRMIWTNDLTIQ